MISTAALATLLFATAAAVRPAAPPPPWGLIARGPAPGLEGKLALFGQFVGDWEFDVVWYPEQGDRVRWPPGRQRDRARGAAGSDADALDLLGDLSRLVPLAG